MRSAQAARSGTYSALPPAAFGAVDRAAEVDGIAQDRHVVLAQLAGEDIGQFVPHLAQGAIAVRLKERDDTAGMRLERRQRRGHLVGVVAEIVDHRDAGRGGADDVEAPREARERGERGHRLAHRHAGGAGGGDCGQRIGEVVASGDLQG
jgi:hypothetical protein